PCDVPYLAADTNKVAAWEKLLAPRRGPRIGIVCSGNPRQANDRNRSMPLAHFGPLLAAGERLYLLQTEVRAADEAYLRATPGIVDLRPHLTDFDETA